MRIEEGKYYRAANGEKIGPMKPMVGVFIQEVGDGYSWNPDGTCYGCRKGSGTEYRLVAEWAEGPVRTVTRQEIIPGTYDGVKVGERMSNEVWAGVSGCMNADQLDRAAAVLTALAGALRDDR